MLGCIHRVNSFWLVVFVEEKLEHFLCFMWFHSWSSLLAFALPVTTFNAGFLCLQASRAWLRPTRPAFPNCSSTVPPTLPPSYRGSPTLHRRRSTLKRPWWGEAYHIVLFAHGTGRRCCSCCSANLFQAAIQSRLEILSSDVKSLSCFTKASSSTKVFLLVLLLLWHSFWVLKVTAR